MRWDVPKLERRSNPAPPDQLAQIVPSRTMPRVMFRIVGMDNIQSDGVASAWAKWLLLSASRE